VVTFDFFRASKRQGHLAEKTSRLRKNSISASIIVKTGERNDSDPPFLTK
jgi:hypothetical protein